MRKVIRPFQTER